MTRSPPIREEYRDHVTLSPPIPADLLDDDPGLGWALLPGPAQHQPHLAGHLAPLHHRQRPPAEEGVTVSLRPTCRVPSYLSLLLLPATCSAPSWAGTASAPAPASPTASARSILLSRLNCFPDIIMPRTRLLAWLRLAETGDCSTHSN